jgi:hypothetical protein
LCTPDGKIVAEASLRDRRINILDAAARPLVVQGFAATSLDRVSDEIGSGRGRDLLLLPQKAGPVPRGSPPRDGVSPARNTYSSRERGEGA